HDASIKQRRSVLKMNLAKGNGGRYTQPQRAPCGSTCVGADTARVAASSLRCLCPIFLKHDGRKRKARSNHSMKPTRAATVDVRAEIDLRACGLSLIR